MGPAVLNGGFSTFLSFILLANSTSHVFETFFKIFFLVITFALFNGLFVLPIALSHFGPHNDSLVKKELDTIKDDAELKTAMIEPTVTIANA